MRIGRVYMKKRKKARGGNVNFEILTSFRQNFIYCCKSIVLSFRSEAEESLELYQS